MNPKRSGFSTVTLQALPNHVVVLGGTVDGKLARSVQVFDYSQGQFVNTKKDHMESPILEPYVFYYFFYLIYFVLWGDV